MKRSRLGRSPLPIVRMEAVAARAAEPPPAAAFVIFEADGHPVGHLVHDPADHGTPAAFAAAMRDAVDWHAMILNAAAPSPAFPGTVSVAICTRDRPSDLDRCLAALARQTRAPDEVLVVDNAREPGPARAVAARHGARLVEEPRPGLDRARNAAVRAARGELLLFTDDDVEPAPDWVAAMAAAFDAPEVEAVTGLVLPAALDTEAEVAFERDWGFNRGYGRIDFDAAWVRRRAADGPPTWEIGAGASMGFRHAVFSRLGLFDERLGAGASGCADDSEYFRRVLAGGGICRYEPRAVALHHHRREVEALRGQIRAYMRGHVSGLLFEADRYGSAALRRRALFYLPAWLAKRCLKRALGLASPREDHLGAEVVGVAAGYLYYLRHRSAPDGLWPERNHAGHREAPGPTRLLNGAEG